MSKLHRKLCRLLEQMEYGYNEEEPVGVFQIDCFVSDLGLGFEADGPHHVIQQKHDKQRDETIWKMAGIRILRLNDKDLSGSMVEARLKIQEFVKQWSQRALLRRQNLEL